MADSMLTDLANYLSDHADARLADFLDEARDTLSLASRKGCFCEHYTKPCQTHDAYDDGICDLIDMIQGCEQ